MIKKILFATSGTGQNQEMLKYLLELPALQSASITMLHVIPSKTTGKEDLTAKKEEGEKLLQDTISALKLDPNKVTTILEEGEPKDIVCKKATELEADLIIMGSRGLKRLQSILENSVSQYVFQLTERPMLLVKDDIYVKKIKRVMVAIDKSNSAQHALDVALFMLRDTKGVQLSLVRVNPDLNTSLLPLSKEEIENNPILAPALAKARKVGIDCRGIVTGGKPSKQICNLAEENNIDLLIIGSPDRRPSVAKVLPDLDRLLGSSLSDYVRVNATCPVLLARTVE